MSSLPNPNHARVGPQHALPPIPEDPGRNAAISPGVNAAERAVKGRNRMQRTASMPRNRPTANRKCEAERLIPRLLDPVAGKSLAPTPPRKESQRRCLTENQRLQDMSRAKQLGSVATAANPDSSDRTSTPSSPDSTPVAPFETDDNAKPKLSLATNILLQESEFRLTPIETDLGVLAVIASLPDSARSSLKRGNSIKRTLTIKRSRNDRSGSVTAIELPSGSVVAVITPERSAWQKAIYYPGEISFESHSPGILISSVLTPLDLLQESVDQTSGSRARNSSDEAVHDDIVEFFETFGTGFGFETLNTDLDKFWIETPVTQGLAYQTCIPKISVPKPRLPLWYHNLPEKTFSFTASERSFGAREPIEWRGSLAPKQSGSSKVLHPSSPLPPLSCPLSASSRTSKPGKRSSPGPNTQRISIRRLLHSATSIV